MAQDTGLSREFLSLHQQLLKARSRRNRAAEAVRDI